LFYKRVVCLMRPEAFQQHLLAWFDRHGRKELPWQQRVTPYRVWVSEIMLQQTQVVTVVPYFNRFVQRFPDVDALAAVGLDEVLQLWSGLGYYARARNLHKSARLIVAQGAFPDTLETLMLLPGVGRSTAGAILSIAFNKSHPILDGNVKRVLARFRAIAGWPGMPGISQQLWALSVYYTPSERVAAYTQAIMDLGATVCIWHKPGCSHCPLKIACLAKITNTVSLYPGVKPTKFLTVKHLVLLVAYDQDQRLLLEKRPPTGVWGGLWSLPEFDSVEAALDWCANQGGRIRVQQPLTKKRHTFSHFHLDYTPLRVELDIFGHSIAEVNRMDWYKAEQIKELALPAPVKQLLQKSIKGA